MYYSIAVFCGSILFGIWMLISGEKTNKLKREHSFWLQQIAIRRSMIEEKRVRE